VTVRPGPLLSPATGEHGDIYTVKNTGSTPCTLSGYPTVTLTSGGRPLGFQYVHGGGPYVTRKPPVVVSLRPGATGYFLLAKYRCDLQSTATATTVRIRLPGQVTEHVLPTPTTTTEHGASVLTYCTGVGKVLLAWTFPSDEAIAGYVSEFGPLQRRTRNTIVTTGKLAREMTRIRERGYALDLEESEEGVRCIAFAVFLGRSIPQAAISISAPRERLSDTRLLEMASRFGRFMEEELSPRLP